MSRSRRYRDIKARLKQNRPPLPTQQPVNDALGQVLDDINAWGMLEAQQQAEHGHITCFGPAVYRGYLPQVYAGVLLWYKQRGYYFYDTIQLIGIWALRQSDEQIAVRLAQRPLHYALPFFNPESYYRLIQSEFCMFYKDDGSPSTVDTQHYSQVYVPDQRLEIRRALELALAEWALRADAKPRGDAP